MTKKNFKGIGADLFFSSTSVPIQGMDTVKDLKINPIFKSLIPPLSHEEYSQLEENLLQNGIREAISVWNETIIDGHNRYGIAKKHNLPYKTINYDFKTEDDVIFWIVKNQFGRRNLSAYDRAVLALRLKPIIAERAKSNQGTRSDISQNSAESYLGARMNENKNTPNGTEPNFSQNSAENYLGVPMSENQNTPNGTEPNFSQNSAESYLGVPMSENQNAPHGTEPNFSQNSAESYLDAPMSENPNAPHGTEPNFSQNSAESYLDAHMNGNPNAPHGTEPNFSQNSAESYLGARMNENKNTPNGTEPNFSQNSAESIDTRKKLAEIAGVSHDTISKVEKIERLATLEIKEQIKRGDISIHRAYQNISRREADVLSLKLPASLIGTYNVIYADYPWSLSFPKSNDIAAANNRPLIKLKSIKTLEIPADDDAILFMWATSPVLDKALQVMGAWGFTYRTCAVWDKTKQSVGQWFMEQHELLLIGTKGTFNPPPEYTRLPSIYSEEICEHSAKPDYYCRLIEDMFPHGRYLELFANEKHRDKWTVWSTQILCGEGGKG